MLTTNRRAARACSLLMAVLLVITGFAGCGKPTKPAAITPNYQSSFVDQLMNIDQSGPNEKVWLIDFSAYKESKDIPGAYVCLNVTMRKTYTFSFDYCVVGETLGASVINAANEWGMGSSVKFENNRLQGKGSFSSTFEADYPFLYPVFQDHIPKGAPKLYIWNLSLVKEGDTKNLLKNLRLNKWQGEMAQLGLISEVDTDTDALVGSVVETVKNPICLFDFEKYIGEDQNPGAVLPLAVEKGKEYTFSFEYCVIGETTGTTVINAASEWGMGSKVQFKNNRLAGKGKYSFTFTADYPQLYPVFQTHVPKGKPKLYVWNIRLVEKNTQTNLAEELSVKHFQGIMQTGHLVSFVQVDTSALKATIAEIAPVSSTTWLVDFAGYTGDNKSPGLMLRMDVKKGRDYRFSFDYCVVGQSTGTTVINAASEWNLGSKVKFPNGTLVGKGSYETSFTADYPYVYPVFQTNVEKGKPQLYIWNLRFVDCKTGANLLEGQMNSSFDGDMMKAQLVTPYYNSTDALTPTVEEVCYIAPTAWKLDFSRYAGENEMPGALFKADVEKGKNYTFSFDYCVIGESTGTNVINAASSWGMGSQVVFSGSTLSGKGSYSSAFTADTDQVYPVFQSKTSKGKPELYVWNIRLVEDGNGDNLCTHITDAAWNGELVKRQLLTVYTGNPADLQPTVSEIDYLSEHMWLIDFSQYTGENPSPNLLLKLHGEIGKQYRFAFDYCVIGESAGTSVINAACEWGLGSAVRFPNSGLTGKGTYETVFTADHTSIYPVFQTSVHKGKPQLYIWNLRLEETDTRRDMLDGLSAADLDGDMAKNKLVTAVDLDPDTLHPTVSEVQYIAGNTWLLDFSRYTGENAVPGMLFKVGVEKGKEYTFSFDYCVIGETAGTKLINAAAEWGMGSQVRFSKSNLVGKGTYSSTFTADYGDVYPVFQSTLAKGAPQLYLWNLRLVQKDSTVNLLETMPSTEFGGELAKAKLVTVYEDDPASLVPTVKDNRFLTDYTFLADFAQFTGAKTDPNLYFRVKTEKGKRYTFSFDYSVVGETIGTAILNGEQAWSGNSKVNLTQKLSGNGHYSNTFTADYASVLPVLQSNLDKGKPQVYIWNLRFTDLKTNTEMLAGMALSDLSGDMVKSSLVTVAEQPDIPQPPQEEKNTIAGNTWLLDFSKFNGSAENPNLRFRVQTEKGKTYTLSFRYCVVGETTGTALINGEQAWSGNSKVNLTQKFSGKGVYSKTFTADYASALLVFQSNVYKGKPQLYISDLTLTEEGSGGNLLNGLSDESFQGDLVQNKLVTVSNKKMEDLQP